MIQRIQSIYLLIVTGLLIAAMCLPVGQFIASDGVTAYIFKPLGVTLTEDTFQSTWGLFGILFLSTVVAFCTIFLFRNRMLQVRMTVFNSILLIGYYAAFFVFMFMLKDDLDAMTFQLGWALCLPAITWEKGKRVRYTLSLTSDAAQVTFGEPEWGEWSDAEPQADPITPVK